jgi:aryl-alcohol dehydrogenase-like predicted oxidoreductase
MKRTKLGKSDLEVSNLCLGAMYFGTKVAEKTSFRLLDQYVEAGGNFIDTANCYAFWIEGGVGDESEALLGRWIKERGNSDTLTIATKVGCRPSYVGAPYPNGLQGLRGNIIIKEVENSLRRLGIDTIDLYYTHQDDRSVPLEETLKALDQLVNSGKIRHIGCSNIAAWRIGEAKRISEKSGYPSFCCVQLRHTFLPGDNTGIQLNINEEHLDFAKNHDLSLLAYSPLLQGAYTQKDRPVPDEFLKPGYRTRLAVLHSIADDLGATPNQVILAWMLQNQPLIIPVIAASTSEQLKENLAATNITLTEDQLATLSSPKPKF